MVNKVFLKEFYTFLRIGEVIGSDIFRQYKILYTPFPFKEKLHKEGLIGVHGLLITMKKYITIGRKRRNRHEGKERERGRGKKEEIK